MKRGAHHSVFAEVGGASWGVGAPSDQRMEAPPGIEPGMEVLQTSALPLGDGALWEKLTDGGERDSRQSGTRPDNNSDTRDGCGQSSFGKQSIRTAALRPRPPYEMPVKAPRDIRSLALNGGLCVNSQDCSDAGITQW